MTGEARSGEEGTGNEKGLIVDVIECHANKGCDFTLQASIFPSFPIVVTPRAQNGGLRAKHNISLNAHLLS